MGKRLLHRIEHYLAVQECSSLGCSRELEASQLTLQNLGKLSAQQCQVPLELVRSGGHCGEDGESSLSRTLIHCPPLPKLELVMTVKRGSWNERRRG